MFIGRRNETCPIATFPLSKVLALIIAQLVRKFPFPSPFMGPEDSLPCSQESATGRYPVPAVFIGKLSRSNFKNITGIVHFMCSFWSTFHADNAHARIEDAAGHGYMMKAEVRQTCATETLRYPNCFNSPWHHFGWSVYLMRWSSHSTERTPRGLHSGFRLSNLLRKAIEFSGRL
jgi:hypothetical protein